MHLCCSEYILPQSEPELSGILSTREYISSTTTSTTEETTTTTTEEPEQVYPPVQCGGNGFYQVGESCYTFTFYRSLTFAQATEFCKV